jgi:hypothetical protein
MKKLIYLCVISLSITGCFSKQLIIDPIPCEKFKDCKETIKKIFALQNPKKAPLEITVTDESIVWLVNQDVHHNVTGATTSHTMQNTLYFKDIEALRLVKDNKPHTYEIRFINRANRKTYIISLRDQDYALQGYSAIKCLMGSVNKNPNTLY